MDYIITVIISLACTVGILCCLDINIYKTYRGEKQVLLKHKLLLPVWLYVILIGISFLPSYVNLFLMLIYNAAFFPVLIYSMYDYIIQDLYPKDKFPRKKLVDEGYLAEYSYEYRSVLVGEEKSYLSIRKGTPLYLLKRIIVFIFGGLWRLLNKKV